MKQFYLASCVLSVMILMLFAPLVASAEEGNSTEQQREQQRYQPRSSRGSEKSDDNAFEIQELMDRQTKSENLRDSRKSLDDPGKYMMDKVE
jgi:hypothetical protein